MLHAVHTNSEVAPTAELYAPSPHAVQPVVDVVRVLYAPAAQGTHEGKLVYVPAPHEEQPAALVAPTRELKRPEAQAVQPAVPVARSL